MVKLLTLAYESRGRFLFAFKVNDLVADITVVLTIGSRGGCCSHIMSHPRSNRRQGILLGLTQILKHLLIIPGNTRDVQDSTCSDLQLLHSLTLL